MEVVAVAVMVLAAVVQAYQPSVRVVLVAVTFGLKPRESFVFKRVGLFVHAVTRPLYRLPEMVAPAITGLRLMPVLVVAVAVAVVVRVVGFF